MGLEQQRWAKFKELLRTEAVSETKEVMDRARRVVERIESWGGLDWREEWIIELHGGNRSPFKSGDHEGRRRWIHNVTFPPENFA